jgi:hypothetical protein
MLAIGIQDFRMMTQTKPHTSRSNVGQTRPPKNANCFLFDVTLLSVDFTLRTLRRSPQGVFPTQEKPLHDFPSFTHLLLLKGLRTKSRYLSTTFEDLVRRLLPVFLSFFWADDPVREG